MTQDEIIEMANEAGFNFTGTRDIWCDSTFVLVAFAKLVAEKATEEANARANASWTLMCKKMVAFEREACAKACDELYAEDETVSVGECVNAIRARGEA